MAKLITETEYEEFLTLRNFKKQYDHFETKVNELGQLVDKLSAFASAFSAGSAGSISRAGVKAPAKVKKLNRKDKIQQYSDKLRGRKKC